MLRRDRQSIIKKSHSSQSFFDKVRILEDGTYAKLLAQGISYHRFWIMQAGDFLPEEDSSNSMVATA